MIEIKAMEPRDEKRQVAFFTIDGQEFSCGNVPADLLKVEDVQTHLDSRADEFKLLLLRREYPGSDLTAFKTEENTELEAMEEWILKGHKNKVIIGYINSPAGMDEKKDAIYGDKIIIKKALEYKHPSWIGIQAKIDSLNIAKGLKDVLKEIVKR